MSENGKYVLCATAVLALGLGGGMFGSTVVASRTVETGLTQHQCREQTLTVTGSARKSIRSDLVEWRIHVRGDGVDLPTAYKDLQKGCDEIEAFLRTHGFKQEEISARPIQTTTHYKQEFVGDGLLRKSVETRQVESYALSRTYLVSSSRVNEVAGPAGEITKLIERGVQITSQAPDYYYTKLAELKVEMVGEASKDARARADQIVRNAGCEIAEVRSARLGVMQITQPNSTDVSDGGIHDTTTVDKDVTSVVSLTLSLRNPR